MSENRTGKFGSIFANEDEDKVREMLRSGQRPDPRIMRPETADILIAAHRGAEGSA